MSSIDERVVELKFNNAQFETAVQQSLTTLGNLKNALSFGVSGAAKGLSGLSNVGSKLGNMGLNTVSSALESVTSKFSVLGTIGDQALRRITDSALSMGKNLLTAIPNQIIEGGKRRSQNLEQAKFQLNGLKIAWEDVSKSIDEAVGGTAYGMDEAAKACSQFAASGVKLGDDMTTALTAISGVAAMTNSSYDDTARIFTTVAGQGRLMGDQLNQLASRGLNVAATLGKALGKSEKEIREMVSKGKIDFKTFAEVMNKEFGEHAKDAGATFTGALSNVKAALSRMGEGFATPTYDALRRTFNELIPVLKQVEVLIKPLAGAFEVVADAAATAAEYGLKQLLGQLQKIVPQVDNAKSVMADKGKAYMKKVLKDIGVYQWLADKTNKSAKQVVDLAGKTFMTGGDIMKGIVLGSDEAQEAFKELRTQAEVTDKVVQDVINGKYGTGEERKRRLTEEFGSWEAIQNKVNETLGCSKRYEVSQKENTEKAIELAAETKKVAENTKKTEQTVSQIRIQKLLTGLNGIKSALNIIKTASSAIFKDIVRPLIGWAAPKVLDGFLSIFSAIGSSLTKFDNWSSKNNFFEGITSRINRFATAGGSKLGEFLDKVKNLQGVKNLAAAFKNLGESLKNFGGGAVDKIAGLFDSLISGVEKFDSSKTDGITNFIDVLSSLGSRAINNVSSFIKQFNTFAAIVTKLEGVRHLTDSLIKLKDAIFGFFSDKLRSLTDWLSGFLGTGEEFDVRTWSDVYRTISKVADGIADFIDSILAGTNPLTVFTKSIGEFLGGFSSGILKDIRLFFAILSGKKFEGDIGTFVPKIKALLRNLSALFGYLKNIKKVGIGTIFKELFNFKGFDPSKIIAKVKAVIMKVMKTIGTGFNIGKSIFTGLMNGLKAIDYKALLTLAGLAGIGKKIYDFFHQFSNATLEIKKIPKNANKILNNLAGTLAAYRDQIRADSLIKVAFAIGILVGALALLTNFVDMNKLAQASADFFVIGVALAAVVAAFALFQKMRNAMPKKEETDEVKEAAEGVSEAIDKVTNSFTASLDKFVGGLNDFLANISKGIAQAAKFAGIGVMLVGFGVAVLLIVVSLKKLEDYDWEKGRESAIALLAIAGTLIIAAAILSQFANSFNASTGVGLLAMAAAVFVLLEAVKSIGKVDPAEIQQGYGCVVILLAMIALIGHVTSAGAGSVLGLAVGMLILAGAMMALLVPIKEYSTVPFDTIAAGVFKLAYSLLFIGGLAALISKLADLKGAAAILILAGAIMVMTPAVMLLGTVGLASIVGISALCIALLALVGIGALGKLTASGLLMLAGGIAAIGGSLLAISAALIGFGASLFVITAGLNFMFAMLPSVLDNVLAFGEYLLGGLKAIGLSVLSWIQSIGPKILPFINGIMVGIGGFLVNQVGPMVSSFFGTAIDVISGAVPVIGGFLKSTVGNIASGVGANIKASAGSLREAFADVIDRIMLRVLTKINEIVPDFVKDFLGIGDKLQTAIDETAGRIELREEKAREAVEPYTEGVEKQMDETVDAVEEGTKKVNEAAEGVEVDTSKQADEAKKQIEEVTKTYGDAAEKTQEEIKKIFDFDSIASEMGIDLTGSADSIIGAFKNTFTSGLADNGEVKNSLGNFLNIFTSPDQAGVDMEAGGKSFFSDFIKGFTSGGDDGGSSTSGILNALIGPLQDPSSAGFDITSIGKNLGIPIPSAMAEGVTENADQPANAIESMFGSLLKGGGGGFDIASAAKNIGIEFPTSLASGITDNSSEATGSANELIEQVISQADSSIDSGNVDSLGTKVTTGFASGIKSGMGTCKAAVTALALASIAAIAAKVPLFKPYGASAGTYYALGILSKKSAATAAGSSIASASVDGAKSKNVSAKGAGIGLGDKMVDGVKSREDAAYRAGARLAEKAIQGFKDKWKKNDPTKDLSNIAPTGNSPGVVKASKDAYSAGSKIGGGAVEGLKKAVEIAKDILDEGIDINPTITPVLDLSQIQNGVGALNGLISPSTVNLGRLNASINASRGSDDKVIDAINSLKAGMKPTGDTYIIEGITYDDGSNVSDAVRTLVTAARKKRRA